MRRCRKQLLFSVIIVLSFILIWVGDEWSFHLFCPFHRITGFPCPGCGGVRAAQALMSMDILTALYINPLSVLLCVLVPVFIILSWTDYFLNKHVVQSIMTKISQPWPTFFIIFIIIINWIWGIYKGL